MYCDNLLLLLTKSNVKYFNENSQTQYQLSSQNFHSKVQFVIKSIKSFIIDIIVNNRYLNILGVYNLSI